MCFTLSKTDNHNKRLSPPTNCKRLFVNITISIAIAKQVVDRRRAEGVDALDVVQSRRGTMKINGNTKIDWEFDQEDLKDEKRWKMQKASGGRNQNQYFAPDGT